MKPTPSCLVRACRVLALLTFCTVQSQAASTITWLGSGAGAGTGTFWDDTSKWSTPTDFNLNTTSNDFGTITTPTTLSAASAGTVNANNIYFGDSATVGSNITLQGNGTPGATTITFSNLTTLSTIGVGTFSATVGTGPIATLASDLTLDLGTNFTNQRRFTTGPGTTTTGAGKAVLLLNSKVSGIGSGANASLLVLVPTVLTNTANTFDAITIGQSVINYASIGNVGAASALGTPSTVAKGTLALNSGGYLSYVGTGGNQSTDRAVTIAGNAFISNNSPTASVETFTSPISNITTSPTTGTIVLRVGATTGNTLVLSNVINDGFRTTSLTKDVSGSFDYYDLAGGYHASTNAGKVILGGANTYTGPNLISAGALLVSNTTGSGTGFGTVTVSTGGTLGGTGTVAPAGTAGIAVATGGFISPGGVVGNIGTLKLDGLSTTGALLTMASGAKFSYDLGAGNASDTLSLLNYVAGDLSLSSTAFAFTGAQAGSFLLFQFYSDSGSTLVSSGLTAANFNLAGSTGLAGFTPSLDFTTTPGNVYLNLVAVPEPTTCALILVGLAAGIARRRRSA